MATTIYAKTSAASDYLDTPVTIGVTNGFAFVGLGISDQLDAMQNGRPQQLAALLELDPETAIELAVALLNAAQNVRESAWGGPTDEVARAASVLGYGGKAVKR